MLFVNSNISQINNRTGYLFILLLLFTFSQICTLSDAFPQEHEIENLLDNQGENSDVSDLLQLLEDMENNPLDLNSVSAHKLALLPWISDNLAHRIVEHRNKYGKFIAIDQLLNIEEFNPALLPLISKYIHISKDKKSKPRNINFRSRAFHPISRKVGFERGDYFNSPIKFYNQFKGQFPDQWKIGLILEKDAGEKRINDFTSFYLKYENPASGHYLIAGHYLLEFAQGLVFWNPYPHLASSNANYTVKKRPRNAVEYTLVDENASLFGLAVKIHSKIYQLYLFYASTKYDATINETDGSVSNFYITGYHRNESELKKKDKLTERLSGLRLQVSPYSTIQLGVTAYASKYDRTFQTTDPVRRRFAFTGNANQVTGLDYDWTIGKLSLFGEMARSVNSGNGIVTGISVTTRTFKLGILYRNYSKNFISLHGNSFGSHGYSPNNEQGLYFGLNINFTSTLKASLYFDHFKFPWRTYFIPTTSQGKMLFASIAYRPMKKLWMYFQIKRKFKDDIFNYSNELILPKKQFNLRFQVDYSPSKSIKLRNRFEKNWVSFETPHRQPSRQFRGILLYQDIYVPIKRNLAVSGRFTVFDTDGYESRLYQFERDLPGIFTNQMLYGQGTRWYLMVNFRIYSSFKLSIKYSSTNYYYRESIGTGSDSIEGNEINAVQLQIDTLFR